MINKNDILGVLDTIIHPETGCGLVEGGFISDVSVSGKQISVILKFSRNRDPFAVSLKRHASDALAGAFPDAGVSVIHKSSEPKPVAKTEPSKRLTGIKKIIAVASGKGGVGKSTVAANLATALAAEGYIVGILDADIYGPSQPRLFGVPDYMPPSEGDDPASRIVPAESLGVKIMSIGFFIDPHNALVWRGPMATNALRQLIRQTTWGELDYLLIDMPPGTGDVHLSLVHELTVDGAVIVSTPGDLAIDDVRRGVEMFRSEGIDIPVLGIVENMAWFTPAELPDNRYYIFGRGGVERFASEEGIDFLGEIPFVLSAAENMPSDISEQLSHPETSTSYIGITRRIVDKLAGKC
jgi:ATP-binding protein involved in chromosome partitioning